MRQSRYIDNCDEVIDNTDESILQMIVRTFRVEKTWNTQADE